VSLDFFARSNNVSVFPINTQRSAKSSNAHALINHSNDFLFIIDAHLLIKSSNVVYFPLFCLSFCIVSPISHHSPLIEKNHNLI
jgi:hypothetical protein